VLLNGVFPLLTIQYQLLAPRETAGVERVTVYMPVKIVPSFKTLGTMRALGEPVLLSGVLNFLSIHDFIPAPGKSTSGKNMSL
jgi:hypothetical protein